VKVTRRIQDGFFYGESPRWHDGALWFTDVHGQRVYKASLEGDRNEVLYLADDLPSGLGWIPDGSLIVVAMDTQQLRRVDANGCVAVHADLSGVATGTINDMVVSPDGTAFVGDTGFRLWSGAHEFAPGRLIVASPQGAVLQVEEEMLAPNGIALSEDCRTLVVAEPAGARLTAFTIGDERTLNDRRVFADLGSSIPDGICLDAAGAVWLADPMARRVSRVLEGGEITHSLPFDEMPVACVLAGEDRTTLITCVAPHWEREPALKAPMAHLEAVDVDVPGSGRP